MERITHDLIQGTPEWDDFRLRHDGASEAAAMLGLSKTTSRTELLVAKKTGSSKEFSDFVQTRILDRGHEVEALARPIIEEIIGEDLYPVTMSMGRRSASCDGLTMDDTIAMEHKQWNAAVAARMQATQEVPDEHMPQCQQVLMVTGAEKLIFVMSDGTRENMVYVWVEPDPEWFKRIEAGWEQFHLDLANYQHVEVKPTAAGKSPETLPALLIQVRGEVTDSNLAAFKDHAMSVFGSINRKLVTDEDFAHAAAAVTWCGEVESRLAAAKQHALSQTESIDKLFRTIDEISAEARNVRLELDKLVKARKDARKIEILNDHTEAFRTHLVGLQKRVGPYMPAVPVDFAGAMRGLKTFSSMIDKCGVELARAKIAANEIADRIHGNRTYLRENAGEHAALFPDTATIVLKAPDDLKSLVTARISEHKAELERKEKEIVRKANIEARISQIKSFEALALAKTTSADVLPLIEQVMALPMDGMDEFASNAQNARDFVVTKMQMLVKSLAHKEAQAAAPVAPVAETPAPAPSVVDTAVGGYLPASVARAAQAPVAPVTRAPAAPPSMKLGKISERLGFNLTEAFIKDTLGIEAAGREKNAVLFHDADFPEICRALIEHIESVAELAPA